MVMNQPGFPSPITYSRIIYLSHPIASDIPQWPGDPPVEFQAIADLTREGYYLRRFSMGEHSATHINAPNSFYADGVGIDAYPPESFVVQAVVIDQCDRTRKNPDYTLSCTDVWAWEAEHGEIPAGTVVLLYTGWQHKWSNPEAFINDQHFPGFAPETTGFLLQYRQIAGLGIDTHGIDGGQDGSFASNRQVLAQPRIVIENLTNLDQLPATGTTLAIAPLQLVQGSGSPATILAFVP
jgi:kynurenine formamidase